MSLRFCLNLGLQAESWSQNPSGRNSLTASQDFQPLRSSSQVRNNSILPRTQCIASTNCLHLLSQLNRSLTRRLCKVVGPKLFTCRSLTTRDLVQHGESVPGSQGNYPYVDMTQSRPHFMPPIRAFRVPGELISADQTAHTHPGTGLKGADRSMVAAGDTPLYQHNQSVFATPAAAPLEHGVRASQQDATHHYHGRQLHYGQYGQACPHYGC